MIVHTIVLFSCLSERLILWHINKMDYTEATKILIMKIRGNRNKKFSVPRKMANYHRHLFSLPTQL